MKPLLVEAAVLAGPSGLERGRWVLIEQGAIAGVGSRADFEGVDADRLGGPGTFVVPGFINAHQHGMPHGWAALGCADGPLEPWMVEIMAAPGVDAYEGARKVGAKQLRAGTTTTVHHHYSFTSTPEDYDAEVRALLEGYRDSGIRVVFAADFKDRGEPVHFEDDFFSCLPDNLAAQARTLSVKLPSAPLLLEVLRGIQADIGAGRYGDASLMLGPSGPVWCSDDLLRLLAKVSDDEGFGVTSHVLESPYEKTFGPNAYGGRGTVPALEDFGLLKPGFLISHGCQLTPADAELLAMRGASVVSNPGSNLRLHNGVAPVAMLLRAGVNVAIGTDSMSIGDRDEILDEARLMQALQRPRGARELGMAPAMLLEILTTHGAKALCRSDIGSVAVGASADLVLVDLDRITARGVAADPVAVLIGLAHPDDFSAVIAHGRVVARSGVMTDPAPDPARIPKDTALTSLVADLMPYVRDYYATIPLPV